MERISMRYAVSESRTTHALNLEFLNTGLVRQFLLTGSIYGSSIPLLLLAALNTPSSPK